MDRQSFPNLAELLGVRPPRISTPETRRYWLSSRAAECRRQLDSMARVEGLDEFVKASFQRNRRPPS